ncbi:MAG: NAD(P)H-hydrate dehydratase, partial [Sphaerochaeta sp.]|nr:NAD(P)H-hydrate dehydratase [Sphaerochaeta sp.]
MKHVVLSSEIAKIDTASQSVFRLPALSLMENAAMGVWSEVQHRIPDKGASLVFLCGGGNNGGDALAVARLAYNSGFRKISCILSSNHFTSSCDRQREIVANYGIALISAEERVSDQIKESVSQADFLFDGLASTSLNGPLRGVALSLVELANKSPAFKIAIDTPSGVSEDVVVSSPHFQADLTVTFGMHKVAMFHPLTRSACGEIVVRNPSFPPHLLEKAPIMAELCTLSDISLKKLSSSSYKNKRGHLGIVGGSKKYTGAARLSARSAFASRAGLVTLFCDEDVYPIAAAEAPSVMVRILESVDELSSYDALLIGPGWGDNRTSLLEKIFLLGKSVVLDADGITTLASLIEKDRHAIHGPLIITPHLGELKSLASALYGELPEETPNAFFTMIREIADRLDATLIVKSSLVHIATPGQGRIYIVEGLNPSLGVAGSGDVLSGLIAALVGGGMGVEEASLVGTLLHQKAGSVAHAKYGYYDSETLVECLG